MSRIEGIKRLFALEMDLFLQAFDFGISVFTGQVYLDYLYSRI